MKVRTIKPFDVEKAEQGAEIQTKDRHKVRILSYDIKDEYHFPILAAILEDNNFERIMQYDEH